MYENDSHSRSKVKMCAQAALGCFHKSQHPKKKIEFLRWGNTHLVTYFCKTHTLATTSNICGMRQRAYTQTGQGTLTEGEGLVPLTSLLK